jgi:hypothetical protein
MHTLVGEFRVEVVATGYTNRRAKQWRATWFVHRISEDSQSGWEVCEAGELRGPFVTDQAAKAAAHKIGVHRARVIQEDMDLPEIIWWPPIQEGY